MSDSTAGDVYGDLADIFRAGLDRANPVDLITSRMRVRGDVLELDFGPTSRMDLSSFDRIVVVGAGKASARMALAVEQVLGDRIDGGVVAVKYGHGETLRRITLMEAGHPVPDGAGVRASRALADMAREADERTLVIGLFSGGGSAILCAPLVSLADKQAATEALLECGATIDEVNCVRKHLSSLKGGKLARLTHPATSLNLMLSDVIGADPATIASGPTVGDPTSYADALRNITSRGISERLSPAVIHLLEQGVRGDIPDNPRPDDPLFDRSHTLLVGTNRHSVQAAATRARELGYHTIALTSRAHGEAREIGRLLAGVAGDCANHGMPIDPPACIIAGGETTVTVRGGGVGGRNQEMALAFLDDLARSPASPRIAFLSASTDGTDGPTDAAGAFASMEILEQARRAGLDPAVFLQENDSYTFYDRIGRLLRTGPTRTNVCDLHIIVVSASADSETDRKARKPLP